MPDGCTVEILAQSVFKGGVARPGRIAILAAWAALCLPIAPAAGGPSAALTSRARRIAAGAPRQAAFHAQPTTVAANCPLPRPGDEVWVVSCRGLGCDSPDEAAERMKYWRYDSRRWTPSDRETFLAGDPQRTTSFFVVGNDYSHAETVETGWFAYRSLIRKAPEGAPLRFVIWSWPADQIPGWRLRDARIKLWRTPAAAFYLAWLADRLPQETPISMSGSSFGARIVMGSLELLAGGRVGGYQLVARADRKPRAVNAVLLGAALDNDDLLPGQPFGHSLTQVNRLLVFTNQLDHALRFYRYLFGRRSRLTAIGIGGPIFARGPGGRGDKIVTREVSNYVGRKHGPKPFFESPTVRRLMQAMLFNPPSGSAAHEPEQSSAAEK